VTEPLEAFFGRVSRQLARSAAARGVAAGLAAALPAFIFYWSRAISFGALLGVAAVAAVAGSAIAVLRVPRRHGAVAARVEARTAAPRNLLITAAELLARESNRPAIRPDVRDVVLRDAAEAAERVSIAELFPWTRAAGAALLVAALWAAGLALPVSFAAKARELVSGAGTNAPAISRVSVTVTPPSYTARPDEHLRDPERIAALAGSKIHLSVDAVATAIELAAAGERHRLAPGPGGRFVAELVAAADGFVALQAVGAGETMGVRQVIALAIVPDRGPEARITTPGKDLYLTAASANVPVAITASDDIGLSSLRLTYTKVSGSGESFAFTTGAIPLQIARARATEWIANGSIPLASLGLAPGDMLVYRALVTDARPGAETRESDAFVIEILAPGEAMAEGFAIDETQDKYALSQQMIIVKTERLIARQRTLSAEAFANEAHNLAAEQRRVRAEFVFMMGGELEDLNVTGGELNEEAEAANESELLSGRLQNNGRRDIILATRLMSGAAANLTNINPGRALPQEKSALTALQRAFTKSRYILRVLTPRERIDDQRRLSGKLADASDWRRPVPDATEDPRSAALRRALDRVAPLAGLPRYGAAEANALSTIAELILGGDEQSPALQKVALGFAQASQSITSGKAASETAALIDAAAVQLSAAARAELAPAPGAESSVSGARLRGALADALRRAGGRR
jgi:hypothetical protein